MSTLLEAYGWDIMMLFFINHISGLLLSEKYT